MHIAIFNQHHHNPDCPATCRHYSFMEHLAEKHKLSLVTTDAWRQLKITDNYKWLTDGIDLYESKVAYHNKMGIAGRLFSYGGFAAYCLKAGLQMQKPDVIWAVSTPLSTPWMAAKVAKLRDIPWVFEVQDLWPSFPIEMGAVKSKLLQKLLYREEKKLYQSAAHIITLSPDMTGYVLNLGISKAKVTTNYNGTDLDLVKKETASEVERLRLQYNPENKKTVLYAGTYGRANDIPMLLAATQKLAHRKDIQFLFTGGGFYESEIKAAAEKQGNIKMLPPIPRHQVFALFKLADISLVTFNDLPVLATNSPAKFYDSLASGTPVIVTNPGWTKAFVEEHNCGWFVPAGNPEKLAEKISDAFTNPETVSVFGKNGSAIAREEFDRRKLGLEIEAVLRKVINEK